MNLSCDAWTLVLPYLPNHSLLSPFENHVNGRTNHQLKLATLCQNAQVPFKFYYQKWITLLQNIHNKMFALRSETFDAQESQYGLNMERVCHSMYCTRFDCEIKGCEKIRSMMAERPDLRSYYFICASLRMDVTPHLWRYQSVSEESESGKMAWFWIFRNIYFMLSIETYLFLVNILKECSLQNGQKGYDAILIVLTWYVRITNEFKERKLVSSIIERGYFRWGFRSWLQSCHYMIEGWLCNKRFPFFDVSDDIIRDYSVEKNLHRCKNCTTNDEQFIVHLDNIYLRVTATRIQYNVLFEEVGYVEHCAVKYFNERIIRYVNHNIEFETAEQKMLSLPPSKEEWNEYNYRYELISSDEQEQLESDDTECSERCYHDLCDIAFKGVNNLLPHQKDHTYFERFHNQRTGLSIVYEDYRELCPFFH